jgi:cytochrome c biogenesis protein CcdA
VSFSLGRIHQVLAWATVSATVGLVFRMIDDAAERAGGVGQIVVGILRGILGMVWSAITMFVIPSMVYRGTGPIDAIKDSVRVLKKTWGESIVRSLGFGLVQFLFIFVGMLAFGSAIAGVVSMGAGSPAILAVVVLGVMYILGVVFVFMLAHMIFNTALYAYASEGAMAPGYDDEMLRAAFHAK